MTERQADGLAVFRDPKSVAVVGASDDAAKWGYWLARGALQGADRRDVHLVNRRAQQVHGRRCASSLGELGESPDLVAVAVPAEAVHAVVDEALDAGARGLLVITARVPDERALAARVREAGARLLGPNSLGLYDNETRLHLAWGDFTPGPLAIVSQSGQVGTELAQFAARTGLGVARFVSVGNSADITAQELLADLADRDVAAVVAYLESFTDGRSLIRTLAGLRAGGRPVVLLTVGATDASRQAARSHTGALASPTDVVDAACRDAGVARADTVRQAIDIAQLLARSGAPTGRRVGIVGDSGGQGALAADAAVRTGLVVPEFSPALRAQLARTLPEGASVANPVDLAGTGEADLAAYARTVATVASSGEVDATVLTGYFGCYGADVPALSAAELDVVRDLAAHRAGSGPVLVHSMARDSAAVTALRQQGIPTYEDIDGALGALGRTAAMSAAPRAVSPLRTGRPSGVRPGYWAARRLLESAGVPVCAARLVGVRADVVSAARELTPAYVLKAGWLDHKSDVGGVAAGLADADAALSAYDEMVAQLGDGDYVLEEMDCRGGVVEVLVGARRDRAFGPIAVVGAGGTLTELHRDTALALAPLNRDEALALVSRLRIGHLLAGWRGGPPVDVAALADVVVAVAATLCSYDDIAEIELNPVRVSPAGVLAVDALVVTGAAS